jgi:hypothetical protein
MISIFGLGAGAGAGGGAVATTGVIVAAAAGGAIGAALLTAGGTQLAVDLTQPNQTAANASNVSQPHYAD